MIKWIKKFRRKKIKYTEEMRIQDSLWEDAKEDLTIMADLRDIIFDEAKKLGWKGCWETYVVEDELLSNVYDDPEELEKQSEEFKCYGNCRSIIKHIENILNN